MRWMRSKAKSIQCYMWSRAPKHANLLMEASQNCLHWPSAPIEQGVLVRYWRDLKMRSDGRTSSTFHFWQIVASPCRLSFGNLLRYCNFRNLLITFSALSLVLREGLVNCLGQLLSYIILFLQPAVLQYIRQQVFFPCPISSRRTSSYDPRYLADWPAHNSCLAVVNFSQKNRLSTVPRASFSQAS